MPGGRAASAGDLRDHHRFGSEHALQPGHPEIDPLVGGAPPQTFTVVTRGLDGLGDEPDLDHRLGRGVCPAAASRAGRPDLLEPNQRGCAHTREPTHPSVPRTSTLSSEQTSPCRVSSSTNRSAVRRELKAIGSMVVSGGSKLTCWVSSSGGRRDAATRTSPPRASRCRPGTAFTEPGQHVAMRQRGELREGADPQPVEQADQLEVTEHRRSGDRPGTSPTRRPG